MTIDSLLDRLESLRVRLWVEDGTLRFDAPRGVVQGALRDEITRHKTALIERLSAPVDEVRAPAAPIQEMLWSLCSAESHRPDLYIEARAIRLQGALDPDAIEAAVDELARRHESLRTRFAWNGPLLEQVIAPPAPFAVAHGDWRDKPKAEIDDAVNAFAWRAFDLEGGPLSRIGLFRTGETEWVFVLSQHHLITDRWSIGILTRDLSRLYEAHASGGPAPPPPPAMGYARHAAEQRADMETRDYQDRLGFWTARLGDAPPLLNLPTDRPMPAQQSYRGGRIERDFAAPLRDDLESFCRRADVTPFMALFAVYAVLLHRYSGQDSVVVGTPVAGRTRPELEEVAGYFVNTLALRADVRPDMPFAALLDQVRGRALAAFDHQAMPFGELVKALQPARHSAHAPVFQTMFVMQNMEVSDFTLGDLRLRDYPLRVGTAKFPLLLTAVPSPEGQRLVWDYQTDLFERETVARMAGHFETLLRAALARPDAPVDALDLMGAEEAETLFRAGTMTSAPFPRHATIPQLFTERAGWAPDRIALREGARTLSYGDLDAGADRLAARLAAEGVKPGDRVGVALPRSCETIIAFLAVLKAGAAYVPLDLDYPDERLEYMARDSRIAALIAGHDVAWCAVPRIPLMDGGEAPSGEVPSFDPPRGADAPAYVMYTSGSTGRPKGVVVPHRAIVRLVRGTDYAPFDADQVFLQLAPVSFDASTFEIWGSLLNGAQLVMAPPGKDALDGLGDLIRDAGITVLWLTSGLFSLMVETDVGALGGVKTLLAGGDTLSARHVNRVLEALPDTTLINGYGPTENTTFTCCHVFPHRPTHRIFIGRPIANTTVHILDPQGRPVPLGVPGELWTGGDGLSLGYLDQPDLTARRFVDFTLSYAGHGVTERLYATGDLARWVIDPADGKPVVELLGRLDEQVKIRGFRIEPGEVEHALAGLPEITDAAVVVQRTDGVDARLCAFYVPAGDIAPSPSQLREQLAAVLPDHLIPDACVPIDALPVTPNGKLDRAALATRVPVPEPETATPDEAPSTPTETRLAEIWASVLNCGAVGRDDTFFERGGHSLAAVRVVTAVREALAADVGVSDLFRKPALSAFAALIDARIGASATDGAGPAPRHLGSRKLPVSFAQERLWTLETMLSLGASYSVPAAFRLRGKLDVERLKKALGMLTAHHAALNAVFEEADGRIVQHVDRSAAPALPVFDVPEAEVQARVASAAAIPFDLRNGPLLRAELYRIDREDHVLFLAMHHLVCDGWSVAILVRDLERLYAEEAPAPLTLHYPDYAAWQRETLDPSRVSALAAYWRETLEGASDLQLITDFPRPPVSTNRGALFTFTAATEPLDAFCAERDVTRFMAHLAVFAVLLHRVTGQDDFVIGTPVSGRHHPGLKDMVGLFINNLALRVRIDPDETFDDLLARIRETVLDAFEHQDLPFEMVVEALKPERRLDMTPVFQVLFAVDDGLANDLRLKGLDVASLPVDFPWAKFDLSLTLRHHGTSAEGAVEYATDLFLPDTAERFAAYFQALSISALADPSARVGALEMRPAKERAGLPGLQGPQVSHPFGGGIHKLIEAATAKLPDGIALLGQDRTLSFAEMDRRADRIAARLAAAGLGAGTLCGVHMHRSVDLPVTLIAILKTGAAYVPLNPTLPALRIGAILEQARPRVIVTDSDLPDLPGAPLPAVVDLRIVDLDADPGAFTSTEVDSGAAAYVLFTSGSTGIPKGVVIPHRAVCNHLGWFVRTLGLSETDRVIQRTSFDFDASVSELFAPLSAGSCLVVPPPGDGTDLLALAEVIARERVTVLQGVPSLFQILLAEGLLKECRDLRIILSGGEALSHDLAQRLAAVARNARVVNFYGPTEACVDAVGGEFDAGSPRQTVPIGYPVDNFRVYVLDDAQRPVPNGVAGELVIGGIGLADGYLGDPDATAKVFLPDPFHDGPHPRMYRTGDRARLTADGFEYLGRLDRQIKVRGMRIEPGDIESALDCLPFVRESAIVDVPDARGETRLVAAVSTDTALMPPTAESDARAALLARLPAAAVPDHFLWMDDLPHLTSDKIDRRALREQAMAAVRAVTPAKGGQAPRTEAEKAIAEIWTEILGIGDVSTDDNFFDRGGHSLKAVQVASRIRTRLSVDITVRDVFERQTIAELAAFVDGRPDGTGSGKPPLLPAPQRERADGVITLPVSHQQRSLWFLDRLEGGSAAYTTVSAFVFDGALDVAALEAALWAIAERHEVLRTRFALEGDTPVQIIEPAPTAFFHRRKTSVPDTPTTLEAVARDLARHPFDLATEPPARFTLVPLDSGRRLGVLTWHHIATDGWSVGVFVRELRDFYNAFARAERPGSAPLAIQYGDFAVWQKAWMDTADFRDDVEYWTRQLDDAPLSLTFHGDRPRPARQTFAGATHRFRIDPSLNQALREMARREDSSVFMIGLAAFFVLLHRYSGQADILVGTPVANRMDGDTEALIGFFANTLVMPGRMDGNPTFREWLAAVRETVLDGFARGAVPFEAVVDALDPPRSTAHHPVFQVMFNLQNTPSEAVDLWNVSLIPLEIDTGTAKFDLLVTLIEDESGALQGHWEYSTDLFDPASARAMADCYAALLRGAADDPACAIRQLPLSAPEDRAAILRDGRGPSVQRDDTARLHDLFARQARQTPEHVAVQDGAETFSYRDIDAWSNTFARTLIANGVKPNTPVGIGCDGSAAMLVGLLAILKAGGGYVPLDPALPRARLDFIIKDAGLGLVVGTGNNAFSLPTLTVGAPPESDPGAPEVGGCGDDLLYILYTSGSTGTPKGVRLPHRVLVNLVEWQIAEPTFAAGLRTLQFTTLAFDVATQEIFATWASGGTVVTMDPALKQDMPALVAFAADVGVERIFLPFTALRQIAQAWPLAERRPMDLRELITAGERLRVDAPLRAMLEELGHCVLTNQYGPTETHVVTAHTLSGPADGHVEFPVIGRPVANAAVYILDDDLVPTPPGVPGQLWVAGRAVGDGYVNRPDLTEAQFRPDPFTGGVMYATGDLATWRLRDGDSPVVDFLGRIDQQVKIRGFRVETEEVEHALLALEGITDAAVVAWEDATGERRLVAYTVAASSPPSDPRVLKEALAAILPEYMTPTLWVSVPAIPKTASGKIDRRKLPDPSQRPVTNAPAGSLEPPRSATERALAEIWREVLQCGSVGLHDNFFDLGGYSFLLLRVLAEIRKRFPQATQVSIVTLFERPTIAALAPLIDGEGQPDTVRHRGESRRAARRDGSARRRARKRDSDIEMEPNP